MQMDHIKEELLKLQDKEIEYLMAYGELPGQNEIEEKPEEEKLEETPEEEKLEPVRLICFMMS